jgi:FKBP-type peptidyl-prolyl cis-trans isomerase
MSFLKSATIKFALPVLGLFTLASCTQDLNGPTQASFSEDVDSLSYSLGYLYGQQFNPAGYEEFDYTNFVAGFQTGVGGDSSELSEEEMMNAVQSLQLKLEKMTAEQTTNQAAQNRQEADTFLAENGQRPEVMTTESGLQYEVLEEGTGDSPAATDEVEVHYSGTLLDGRKFDSSYDRGETVTFPLNGVIAGWTEGVQLMKEGAKYKFYVPADLGYGDNPRPGGIIEPGSLLIFEVELIDVK